MSKEQGQQFYEWFKAWRLFVFLPFDRLGLELCEERNARAMQAAFGVLANAMGRFSAGNYSAYTGCLRQRGRPVLFSGLEHQRRVATLYTNLNERFLHS